MREQLSCAHRGCLRFLLGLLVLLVLLGAVMVGRLDARLSIGVGGRVSDVFGILAEVGEGVFVWDDDDDMGDGVFVMVCIGEMVLKSDDLKWGWIG